MLTVLESRRTGTAIAALAALAIAVLASVDLASATVMAEATALIVLVVSAPAFVVSMALPLTYAFARVGPASVDVSVADASLLLATIVALPFVPWNARRLQRALLALGAYELLLGMPVLAHPTGRALFEWGHRAVLIGGSLIVGAALVRMGSFRFGLRLFILGSAAVSVNAIIQTLGNGFEPAYPFGMQKNSAGNILAFAVLLVVLAGFETGIRPVLLIPTRLLLIGGLLATQSRGSMLAVIVGVALWILRGVNHRRSSTAAVLVALVALGTTVVLINDRESQAARSDPSAAKFLPDAQRRTLNESGLNEWRAEPIAGAGLRYFYAPNRGGEPHNLLVAGLAETGIIGIAALLVLIRGTFAALTSLRSPIATVARLAILVRMLTGFVDIFWVAGRMTLPWVLVGAAIAIDHSQQMEERTSTRPQHAL
ncbi:MAG: hypothetical protein QOI95_300 [Acidimicrobiaceae bacterium]